jgi:Mg2+/Co2+ transporter CorB
LSPAKVRTLVEEKNREPSSWIGLKNYHRTLIAVLFGNQFVDTLAAAVATVLVAEKFDSIYLGLASGVLTVISLIFGEALPKSLASVHAQTIGLLLAPAVRAFVWILTPLVWILDHLINFIGLIWLGQTKSGYR